MSAAEAFHAYLTDRAAADAFSGVALLTRGDTPLFAEAYGYASRAWQVKADLHTRYDTASVTKDACRNKLTDFRIRSLLLACRISPQSSVWKQCTSGCCP